MQLWVQREMSNDAGGEYVEVYTEVPYPASLAAAKTLERLERTDERCGAMLVAAVDGLASEQPEMTVVEFRELLFRHLPQSVVQHLRAEIESIKTWGR